ncbi:transcription factor TFIIIB component B'' homolog isoform X3 [Ornithorhynchus anatinus]|uniref:transcription factor TFIIIB component B'' homolog isoform X3 n=1 Tax=Ornithorhynchus anatinus TaxID=9258 RepID=UPI0010A91C27|nr:transcription factor TFIIIB component B'' homolog isoform X3 [Ornithorhynchus anatinus]
MFRRARLSVKPNVRAGSGGGPGSRGPQDRPPAAEAAGGTPEERAGGTGDAGKADKPGPVVLPRRKRIATTPNLAKPRVAVPPAPRLGTSGSKPSPRQPTHSPTSHSPSEPKESSPPENAAVENSPKSPILPEKKTPVPQVPQFSPFKKSASQEPSTCTGIPKGDEVLSKNVPDILKDRPAKENWTREEAPQSNLPSAQEKPPPSDRYRIFKAQKLREMLREELKKERKQWKNKCPVNESRTPADRSKMTMRDFIYYLPDSNPMKSSLEQEKKTEKPLTSLQAKEQEEKLIADAEEEDEEAEEENGDGPLLVPRVKVAEDGSIILDEESLTVEVLRTKGPCVVEENDPIFERGSTTTYSSFRRSYYSKPWSNKETDMFFLAISMVGTDFSMIGQLFPHRARIEIKNKFKREEKTNGWRIDKAFQEKRPFDFNFFARLLEKVLAEEERRKQKTVKSQSSKEKKPSKPQKKPKGQVEGQTTIEPAVAKKKRKRKKNVDNDEQEMENLSVETCGPSDRSTEEKTTKKKKCHPIEPVLSGSEVPDEQVALEEQVSSTDVPLSEEVENETNLASSTSSQDRSVPSVTAESAEPDTSCLPPSKPLAKILEKTESSDSGERPQDTETQGPENEKTEGHKPAVRGRLQRPKPNLSRAIGKKARPPQDKAEAENQISFPAPPGDTDKCLLEKNETSTPGSTEKEISERESKDDPSGSNTSEIPGENTPEREDKEVETKSQKTENVASDKQGATGSPQKVTSSGEKALEKMDVPLLDVEDGKNVPAGLAAGVEKNADELGTAGEEATKEHDIVPETEAAIIQENRRADSEEEKKLDAVKPAPIGRSRFQRPKPNLGRAIGRKEVESKIKAKTLGLEHNASLPSSPKPSSEKEEEILSGSQTSEKVCSAVPVKISSSQEKSESLTKLPTPEASVECGGHLEQSSSPAQTSLEEDPVQPLSSRVKSSSQEGKRPGAVQPARLLRGRMQRLKPNVERAVSRLKVPVIQEKTGTEEEEKIIQPENQSTILPTPDTALQIEEEPPSKNTDCQIRPEAEKEVLCPLTIQSDSELKASKTISNCEEVPSQKEDFSKETVLGEPSQKSPSVQEGNKLSRLKPTLPARSRFPRPKPKIGRASGHKESSIPEKTLTEEMSVIETTEITLKPHEEECISGPSIGSKPSCEVPSSLGAFLETVTASSEKDPGVQTRTKSLEEPVGSEGCEEIKGTQSEDVLEKASDASKSPNSKSLPLKETQAITQPTALEDDWFKRPNPDFRKGAEEMVPSETGEHGLGEKVEIEEPEKNLTQKADEPEDALTSIADATKCSLKTLGTDETNLEKIQSCETKKEALPQDNQQNVFDVVAGSNIPNNSQEDSKIGALHPASQARGQLLCPQPSVQTPGQTGATIDKDGVAEKPEQGGATPQKDESDHFPPTLPESRCESKAGSSAISVHKVCESENQKAVEGSLQLGSISNEVANEDSKEVSNEIIQEECKPDAGKPAQMKRRRLQKVKPNVRVACRKKEEPEAEKNAVETGEKEVRKPEEKKPEEQEDPDTQLSLKEKTELLTSLGVSVRKDHISSGEAFSPPKEPHSSDKLIELTGQEHQEGPSLPQVVEERLSKRPLRKNSRLILQEESQKGVSRPAPLLRGRLQRPKPNLQRATPRNRAPSMEILGEAGTSGGVQGPGGSSLGKPDFGPAHSGNQMDLASTSQAVKEVSPAHSVEIMFRKRNRPGNTPLSPGRSAVCADQPALKGESLAFPPGEKATWKRIRYIQHPKEPPGLKTALGQRAATPSASECESDRREKRRPRPKAKPNVTKRRGAKRPRGKASGKETRSSRAVLVTLRASQEQGEDEADDTESDYESERYHLSPEEVNQAPVFVPIGLRSPNPVPAQVEETMEELEISVNIPDAPPEVDVECQPLIRDASSVKAMEDQNWNLPSPKTTAHDDSVEETGFSDGCTEAAMALLTIGDRVFQSQMSTEGILQILPEYNLENVSYTSNSHENVAQIVVPRHEALSPPSSDPALLALESNRNSAKEQQETEEELDLAEKEEGNATSSSCASSSTTFSKLKPNLNRPPETNSLVPQKVPSLIVTLGPSVESPSEPEGNASKGTGLQEVDLRLSGEPESRVQPNLANLPSLGIHHDAEEDNQVERTGNEEKECQGLQTPGTSPKARSQPHDPDASTNQSPSKEQPRGSQKDGHDLFEVQLTQGSCKGDVDYSSIHTTHPYHLCVVEGASGSLGSLPTGNVELATVLHKMQENVSEAHQQNVISADETTVNLIAGEHSYEENGEQTFILTLVEIPTDFSDAGASLPLASSSLLPVPILVNPVNSKVEGIMAKQRDEFPVASASEEVTDLARDGGNCIPEQCAKSPTDLSLTPKKRLASSLNEVNCISPAKKTLAASADDCLESRPEVLSTDLKDVPDPAPDIHLLPPEGDACGKPKTPQLETSPTSGSVRVPTGSPQAQDEQPASLQTLETGPLASASHRDRDQNVPQLPQEGRVPCNEEGTIHKAEKMERTPSSSKAPLSRRGRKPLGFLSLICKKSNSESEESTFVTSQRLIKPRIPVARRMIKRNASSNEDKKENEEAEPLPSTSTAPDAASEDAGSSVAQVPRGQASEDEGSRSDKELENEEGPTRISEYFFSDIFMEVDDAE